MRYVIGVIPPDRLEAVRRALEEGRITRLTVGEVEVVDADSGLTEPRLRLEVAVNDDFLKPALSAFESAVLSVSQGESKRESVWVSVLPLEETMRIRTGETGPEAI